ncbi:MAG: ATP-binding protein, partial [bacterium]|nr:ATP-binding protein [bacterium]
VIYGPRQSGKTTLFLFMVDYLNAGGINTGNIWYVNLDVISTHSLFENSETFLYLFDKMQMEDRIYLFLDEIQRLKNPGLFLKGLYDSRRNIKVFVSGSASFELKAKVKEFLTGRKRQHLVLPLSFREIIAAQGIIPPEVLRQEVAADTIEDWEKANDVYGKYLMEELDNVMLYGLYPGVYAQPDRETKLEELYEIYNTYLKKDIFDYFKIERPEVFNNLVKVFAGQAGNMINISELCSLLSGARSTVEKYISILKDTFIVSLLNPFTSNKRSEIKYAAKVYFLDLGIRNFVQKNLSPILSRSDAGSMIENVVFIEMQKNLKLLDDVHYWRTKSKAEVDFILSGEGGIIPVEVKAGSARIGTLTRSFHSFIDTYKPRQAVFINKDKFGYTRVHETDVFYIPVYWFLLISGNLRFCKREKRNTEDTERNEN